MRRATHQPAFNLLIFFHLTFTPQSGFFSVPPKACSSAPRAERILSTTAFHYCLNILSADHDYTQTCQQPLLRRDSILLKKKNHFCTLFPHKVPILWSPMHAASDLFPQWLTAAEHTSGRSQGHHHKGERPPTLGGGGSLPLCLIDSSWKNRGCFTENTGLDTNSPMCVVWHITQSDWASVYLSI